MLGLRLPEIWRSAMYGMKNTFVRNCSSSNHFTIAQHSAAHLLLYSTAWNFQVGCAVAKAAFAPWEAINNIYPEQVCPCFFPMRCSPPAATACREWVSVIRSG